MTDATFQAKIYKTQGGDKLVVAAGGVMDFEAGTGLTIAGTDRTAALATAPAGVAAGYKVSRGEIALGGTNPTAVATGLSMVIAFTATLKGTAAPGVGTSVLTANIAGAAGNTNVYAWNPTSNADPTLIASTGTESFYWIAIGT